MDKFLNKFRIPSARMQNWDYSTQGAYFITICVHNRQHCFGRISEGRMCLSRLGIIADIFWHEIENHARQVAIGEYVIMPNHMHGIMILKDNTREKIAEGIFGLSNPEENTQTPGQKRFQNQGRGTVSSIVSAYKSAVSKHAHRLAFEFKWQSRFHEHIIRDDQEYIRIANYIIDNPKKWQADKFYTVL